jgi:hypothetical protein
MVSARHVQATPRGRCRARRAARARSAPSHRSTATMPGLSAPHTYHLGIANWSARRQVTLSPPRITIWLAKKRPKTVQNANPASSNVVRRQAGGVDRRTLSGTTSGDAGARTYRRGNLSIEPVGGVAGPPHASCWQVRASIVPPGVGSSGAPSRRIEANTQSMKLETRVRREGDKRRLSVMNAVVEKHTGSTSDE